MKLSRRFLKISLIIFTIPILGDLRASESQEQSQQIQSSDEELRRGFTRESDRLYRQESHLEYLRNKDIKKYLKEMGVYLNAYKDFYEKYEAMYPENMASKSAFLYRDFVDYGNLQRYVYGNNKAAIEAYESALQFLNKKWRAIIGLVHLRIADTARFGLNQPERAINHYELSHAFLDNSIFYSNLDGLIDVGGSFSEWVAKERDYLKTDSIKQDTILKNELLGFAPMFTKEILFDEYSNIVTKYGHPEAGPVLSQFSFYYLLINRWSKLDVNSIISEIKVLDPIGYMSSLFFITLFESENGNLVRSPLITDESLLDNTLSSDLYTVLESVIQVMNLDLNVSFDSRFATPEDTWNVYFSSLQSGDIALLLESFTKRYRDKVEDIYQQMSKSQLEDIASRTGELQQVSAIENDYNFVDYVVNKKTDEGGYVHFVYFVRTNRGWKIYSM